ncbi:hypothetical protein [Ectopseudomonas oleovorans]|uniref:Uncharacterized protein n=3 Tax=Ectopseudomonas oleovorans TaxID=301 RepID=A0AA42TYZ6_ECTOL|nr:hypothetical protein [Pseudomonas oleovorans]MDH1341491.1 hypothetical protein [Pseudomonas oleovorans]MDH1492407.1 hypothetical protein [Pseudomonas oleovorans]WGG19251.1 hypothetical protein N5O83_12010 [Pseudomonas oleovorans]
MKHPHALNPSKARAAAHRAMALAALRSTSSLAVRLNRYNHHRAIQRSLEAQANACDWLESLEGDAWADACEEIATALKAKEVAMDNLDSRWELDQLSQRADGLTSAGMGLEAIGRLLNESELHADDVNGLQQAVMALGNYVRVTGFELYAQAEKMKGGAK